jgi:hypothetical protein
MNPNICQDCLDLIRERDELKEQLAEAVSYLREGKAKFAPTTTNSHVDVFLAQYYAKESNANDHRADAQKELHEH